MMDTIWSAPALGAGLALLTLVGFGVRKLCVMWMRSRRRRRTLRAAHHLLRTDRPSADQTWSIDDWDWAFRELGTPEARQQMAFNNQLRGDSNHWLRLVRD